LPKAICFDFFQTLVDCQPDDDHDVRLFSSMGYERCVEVIHHWIDPTQHACIGGQLAQHAPASWPTDRREFVTWQSQLRAQVLREWQVDEAHLPQLLRAAVDRPGRQLLAPLPGVVDALHELARRGIQLGICSNWDLDLEDALERSGLPAVFGAIVTSARVGCPKPHSEIFHRALDRLGVGPDEAWFMGDDWAKDVDGAVNAGFAQVIHIDRNGLAHADPPDNVVTAASAAEAMRLVLDLAAG
jgi:putative hydrolase of the HAD superfamily